MRKIWIIQQLWRQKICIRIRMVTSEHRFLNISEILRNFFLFQFQHFPIFKNMKKITLLLLMFPPSNTKFHDFSFHIWWYIVQQPDLKVALESRSKSIVWVNNTDKPLTPSYMETSSYHTQTILRPWNSFPTGKCPQIRHKMLQVKYYIHVVHRWPPFLRSWANRSIVCTAHQDHTVCAHKIWLAYL